jgi:PHP family Zn ribbon phosphoesterase
MKDWKREPDLTDEEGYWWKCATCGELWDAPCDRCAYCPALPLSGKYQLTRCAMCKRRLSAPIEHVMPFCRMCKAALLKALKERSAPELPPDSPIP